jgi:HK97 gp10 family phage protein
MSADGLQGTEELLQVLAELPENIQKQVLRKWVMKYAKEVEKAAASRAPRGKTGNHRKGLRARMSGPRVLKRKGSIARAVVVGAKPAYHFHIINLGTRDGVNKSGNRRGMGIKPRPFLSAAANPILARAQADVNSSLAREVQAVIDKAIRRTMRRAR